MVLARPVTLRFMREKKDLHTIHLSHANYIQKSSISLLSYEIYYMKYNFPGQPEKASFLNFIFSSRQNYNEHMVYFVKLANVCKLILIPHIFRKLLSCLKMSVTLCHFLTSKFLYDFYEDFTIPLNDVLDNYLA